MGRFAKLAPGPKADIGGRCREPTFRTSARGRNLPLGHPAHTGASLSTMLRMVPLSLRERTDQVFSRQPVTNTRQHQPNSSATSAAVRAMPMRMSPSAWPMKP